MKPLKFTASIELKAAEGSKPRRFAIMAYSGGLLPIEGFDRPVIADLAGMEIPGSVPILIDHKASAETTLGITDEIKNDGKTLSMTGQITAVSPLAVNVLKQADQGHRWQASIGARVLMAEEIPAGQPVEVNGQVFTGPVIVARRTVLRETSVLPMGADATTQVNLAAKAAAILKGASTMTFEDWCKSIGVDPSAVTPEGMAALQLAYESASSATPAPMATAAPVQAPAAPVVAPVASANAQIDLKAQLADFRKQMADESKRIAQIQDISKGYPNITASAIEQNWSVEKVELEVLKAAQARTRPTSFTAAQNTQNIPQVLEAAVCMHRKIKTTEKDYSDQVLQAAHNKYRGGIGLQQLVIMAAAANGMHIEPGMKFGNGNGREILMHACGKHIQAAFSTVNLSGILSNVANKELLQGYMEEDNAWREIAAVKSVSDFKQVTSYRMLDSMEYEELGAGGKIKHGTIGEESYTRQAKTYAKMFAITRTDIINDDMGAFDDLRNRVGRGSAKRLNKVFWTKFINNTSFFTSARTNYIEGATTNLGADGVGMGLGVKAFRNMKSPSADGEKAVGAGGGRPEILLVPPSLESVAEQLYQARNLTGVKTSDTNIYAGKYRPVIAWQLEDSDYTGYSATAWYLLTSPSYLPTMVVSFLNGQETPTVESADADFDTLGIQFRGYHDFGCDQAEYLGGIKSKGAA